VRKVGLLVNPDANGYLLPTATDLAARAVGDATSHQSTPMALDALVSGGAITPDVGRYWEVGTDCAATSQISMDLKHISLPKVRGISEGE
jgi:hypothetical protein